LPCNSSETELGETKKFKDDRNENPEVVWIRAIVSNLHVYNTQLVLIS
jgi:hypothetical protein